MPDSSAIDDALVGMLVTDDALHALLPDGVFIDEANPGASRFVIVSVLDAHDTAMFGGRAYESALYLVKAVARSTSGADIKAAAARIDALLEDARPVVDGYDLMTMHRETRIRITEVDDVDRSIRWYHRGGHYRVMVSAPLAPRAPSWIQPGWIQ